jgi:hypothetical protein
VLAAAGALNITFTTGIIARPSGASTAQAILTAAGAAGAVTTAAACRPGRSGG